MINNRKILPTLQVFHLNVFTEQAFTGNSATVVWLEQNIFKTQMQTLAREFNTPETIFILHNKKQLNIRFFTPTQEVNSCGHGTIAAAYVVSIMLPHSILLKTFSAYGREIKVHQVSKQRHEYIFEVPIPKSVNQISPPITLISALDGVKLEQGYEVNTSPNNKRLLIFCKNERQLQALTPNFLQLKQALEQLNYFSICLFTINDHACNQLSARMFAPNIGINEDPVNGNSSIALASVIHHICQNNRITCPNMIEVYQGKALNRAGKATIHVKYNANKIVNIELSGTVIELYRFCINSLN